MPGQGKKTSLRFLARSTSPGCIYIYICQSVYIYIYVDVYLSICMYVCLSVCMYVCIYIYIMYIYNVYIYIIYIYIVYIYIYNICMYIYIYMYIYINYMYIYICIFIYKYIYIYTYFLNPNVGPQLLWPELKITPCSETPHSFRTLLHRPLKRHPRGRRSRQPWPLPGRRASSPGGEVWWWFRGISWGCHRLYEEFHGFSSVSTGFHRFSRVLTGLDWV